MELQARWMSFSAIAATLFCFVPSNKLPKFLGSPFITLYIVFFVLLVVFTVILITASFAPGL
jgi:hypothetical protein